MTGKNYRSGGQYGFARRPAADKLSPSETLQLVYDREWDKGWDEEGSSPSSDRRDQLKARPEVSAQHSGHANWVVYPKRLQSEATDAEADRLTAEDMSLPAFMESFLRGSVQAPEDRERPKLWLALGFVGLIYVIGFAGIWSIVSTFEASHNLSLAPATAPAKDREALPPLDDVIDLRDALFDRPIVPEFRPEVYAYQPVED